MNSSDEAKVFSFAAAAEASEPDAADTVSTGKRPTRFLPTDRITFQRQLDLLRGWAAASGDGTRPASLRDVEAIVKMKSSTISLANAFFTDTGLLAKSDNVKGFMPSPEVVSFNRAYQWNPETASHKLRPRLVGSWFALALLPKLSFGTITQEEAVQAVAEAVAAEPRYRGQLLLLLDYLEAAAVIEREGDVVRSTVASPQMESTPPQTTADDVPQDRPAKDTTTAARVATSFAQPTDGVVQFHVSVRVDMSEFAGWSPDRITAFFGGIAQVLAAKGQIEEGAATE